MPFYLLWVENIVHQLVAGNGFILLISIKHRKLKTFLLVFFRRVPLKRSNLFMFKKNTKMRSDLKSDTFICHQTLNRQFLSLLWWRLDIGIFSISIHVKHSRKSMVQSELQGFLGYTVVLETATEQYLVSCGLVVARADIWCRILNAGP